MGSGIVAQNFGDMIIIVDYGLGNLLSVAKAFEEVCANERVIISGDPKDLSDASRIILPGVGNFRIGMRNLHQRGLIESLQKEVIEKGKIFLGICLGMQLLVEIGEEGGETTGLGWIPGRTRKLKAANLKLPHIGWDDVQFLDSHPIFKNIPRNKEFYFVHSYCVDCPSEYIIARCIYEEPFAAAIQKGNVFGTQFHPEKSRESGLRLLKNFLTKTC